MKQPVSALVVLAIWSETGAVHRHGRAGVSDHGHPAGGYRRAWKRGCPEAGSRIADSPVEPSAVRIDNVTRAQGRIGSAERALGVLATARSDGHRIRVVVVNALVGVRTAAMMSPAAAGFSVGSRETDS